MTQGDLAVLGATRISVGLSAIIAVYPTAYQYAENIKILSGGGTLEVVTVPTALTGVGAAGWGQGYPLGSAEALAFQGPCTFYLAATGATMIATMVIGRTSGATTL